MSDADPALMSTRRLHRVLADSAAACAADPDLFFAPDGEEAPAVALMRERAANALCAGCPLRRCCLEYALRTRPEHGIWGGCRAEDLPALTARVHAAA